MAFRQEHVQFGNGRVIGSVIHHPDYATWTEQERAERMGRAVGCPVVQHLIRPETGRGGAAGMHERYLQVGTWFGHMVHAAEWANPTLARELQREVRRRPDEPAGGFEPESVPDGYEQFIPAAETLTGFALPRLLIKLHESKALSAESPDDRFMLVWDLLESCAGRAHTPAAMLALCAQGAMELGMDGDEVLSSTLPQGWLEEQNARDMAATGKMAVIQHAPAVWQFYKKQSEADLQTLGVF